MLVRKALHRLGFRFRLHLRGLPGRPDIRECEGVNWLYKRFGILMATKPPSITTKKPRCRRQGTPDSALIGQVEKAILRNAGGLARFRKEIPLLLRNAIDEVIDSARTGRFTLDETKINERIYLATKVRIWMRNRLRFLQGYTPDLSGGAAQVGIQSTISQTWSIPPEVVGKPCILIKSDEKRASCSLGIIVVREEFLNSSGEPSRRRVISRAGLATAHWILKNEPLPTPLHRRQAGQSQELL